MRAQLATNQDRIVDHRRQAGALGLRGYCVSYKQRPEDTNRRLLRKLLSADCDPSRHLRYPPPGAHEGSFTSDQAALVTAQLPVVSFNVKLSACVIMICVVMFNR